MNADDWPGRCPSFNSQSDDLCEALAAGGQRLCVSYVDPSTITAFVACRSIPVDKNLGVRPIALIHKTASKWRCGACGRLRCDGRNHSLTTSSVEE